MLNEENEYEITSKCIDCLPLVYIACPQDNYGTAIMMAPITKEQEDSLDNGDIVVVSDQFDRKFIINPKSCYAYGKLNLSPKSDDIRKLAKANLFYNMHINICVLNVYDYDTHTVTSDVEGGRWYETDNIETYLPFLHGKLGKPERVAIFRKDFDTLSNKRKKNTNKIANHKHYLYSKDYYKSYSKRKTELKRKAKVSNLQFKIKK